MYRTVQTRELTKDFQLSLTLPQDWEKLQAFSSFPFTYLCFDRTLLSKSFEADDIYKL